MTVIVILGSANWASGPSPALRRRTLYGAKLFHESNAAYVVACGGLLKHPPILDDLGTRSIILVTDWYHLPRAKLVARRLGLSCVGVSPGLRATHIGQQARSALREIPAYIAYWLRLKGRPGPKS